MATAAAPSVAAYLAALPPDRRAALEKLRAVIRKNLDSKFEEGIQYGAIGYYVPHKVYPPGYRCDPRQPLPLGGIASRKQYMTLAFMHLYGGSEHEQWFRKAWTAAGKKLDMGKCCVRFKSIDDVPLDVVGEAVRRLTADQYVAYYETALSADALRKARGKTGPPSPAKAKKAASNAKAKPAKSKAAPAARPKAASKAASKAKDRARAR